MDFDRIRKIAENIEGGTASASDLEYAASVLTTVARKRDHLNPPSVCVLLVPTTEGIMLVRRADGGLALPGGHQEMGETWQEAAARETLEETAVSVDPSRIRPFYHDTSARAGVNLLFGVYEGIADTTGAKACGVETTGIEYCRTPVKTAFPIHDEALTRYFEVFR